MYVVYHYSELPATATSGKVFVRESPAKARKQEVAFDLTVEIAKFLAQLQLSQKLIRHI